LRVFLKIRAKIIELKFCNFEFSGRYGAPHDPYAEAYTSTYDAANFQTVPSGDHWTQQETHPPYLMHHPSGGAENKPPPPTLQMMAQHITATPGTTKRKKQIQKYK
jgi:hypothetical protein